ncbi:MAG: phosphodiester glycosidase family protein [Clostridia bacterium]|nr:phosphodiester glycosidase family protein [Clostridia bacterium]
MKKTIYCLCLAVLLLFPMIACGGDAQQPATVPADQTASEEPEIVVAIETPDVSEIAEATVPPTEEPIAVPEETPEPTRAPKEGDVAVHFPDYDTGVDADYSYQSDELRIAITVHQEKLPDHNGRELNETYYVVDIWVRNLEAFRTAYARGNFNSGSEEGDVLARRENAVLAVNGSYNLGLVLSEGKLLSKQRADKGWNSGAIGIIYKDGSLKTFRLGKDKFNVNTEIENGAWYGWQFGPIILRDYEEGPDATKYSGMGFKARNMLGYYEPGHYVIVTCDNRGKDAQGMNGYMMVNMMKSLGVKEAFNLDGGVSAVLVFMGEVINHPTVQGGVEGRPIVDMLVFGEPAGDGSFADLSALTAKIKDN